MMDQLIKEFHTQLKDALEIGESASIRKHKYAINKVVIAGMGGSGIGGALVADMIYDESTCPYIVHNGYKLPSYIDDHTLVIISSYSGNTEETLMCLKYAQKTNAKIVCITSGNELIEYATLNELDCIGLPSGCPSPRAALGYLLVAQLYILYNTGIITLSVLDQIRNSVDLLAFEQEDIIQKAEKIAGLLHKKLLVIYTTERNESLAKRWRQQFNENSKILCWHHVIPELNHNELVGWRSKHEDLAVIFLRNRDDFKRNQHRMDITKQIIGQFAPTVIEIYSKGQTLPEKMMYMVHLGDWVSWYLAQLNNVDASEIKVIDHLKSELSKMDL
ncbi:MAG: bifunctional phosphoglucose/phosphomannose isomerase [Saprospiraceae bacterium]|nr:bifunctional phosphoglucose/phosphomannose isomerase [Saprospiraceae bacterium]